MPALLRIRFAKLAAEHGVAVPQLFLDEITGDPVDIEAVVMADELIVDHAAPDTAAPQQMSHGKAGELSTAQASQ